MRCMKTLHKSTPQAHLIIRSKSGNRLSKPEKVFPNSFHGCRHSTCLFGYLTFAFRVSVASRLMIYSQRFHSSLRGLAALRKIHFFIRWSNLNLIWLIRESSWKRHRDKPWRLLRIKVALISRFFFLRSHVHWPWCPRMSDATSARSRCLLVGRVGYFKSTKSYRIYGRIGSRIFERVLKSCNWA
jgi:hypothetical protein